MLREFQADFEGATLVEASVTARPDAIVPTTAISFGPEAIGDGTSVLATAWYARFDNTAGAVYIARAQSEPALGWEDEAELFSYTGDPVDEMDLTFDAQGYPVVACARAGSLWVRYFDAASGAYVFAAFGAARNPRCMLDSPDVLLLATALVFYIKSGALYWREGQESFLTEHNAGIALADNQYLEGLVRDTSGYVDLILSERDEKYGTYTLSRITSNPYPQPVYPTQSETDRWYPTTDASLQQATLALKDDRVFLDTSDASGGLLVLNGIDGHVEMAALPVVG